MNRSLKGCQSTAQGQQRSCAALGQRAATFVAALKGRDKNPVCVFAPYPQRLVGANDSNTSASTLSARRPISATMSGSASGSNGELPGS